jgi:antitoxin component YwqK of YwqJK toxin-antitoxin module
MKRLLIIFYFLFTTIGCSKDIRFDDLIEIDGLYYIKLMETPFSGEVVVNYINGQISEKFNYKDGILDGQYVKYYENGHLEIKRNYKEGKIYGVCLMYYENGRLYKKSNWKNSELDGEWLQYYKNGKLAEKKNYKKGIVTKND